MLNCFDKLFDDVQNHTKISWVSDVKDCLIDLGLNEIWNEQRCNEGALCVIKQNKKFVHVMKIPVNVHFIETLFHNIAYNATLQNPYLFQKCISKIR